MLRIDEGLLDKNWRPSQKTVVKTKVYLREQVAELNRKVGTPVILTQRAVINKTVFINLEIRAILMVFSPPQEPTRRLCGYDAAVLVVHPVNPKLRMHQLYVAHFQDSLAAPKSQPNHRPIRRETRCCHARLLFSF